MNRLVFIRRVLYRLKQRYGSQIDIVRRVSSVVDRATGLKTISKAAVRVRRAIVLPAQVDKNFAYDLTFIANNKNFTYGGFYDAAERRFIIDTKDLPVDFDITTDMYLLYDGRRYDVKVAERFEERMGFLIRAVQSTNVDAEEIHYPILEDTLPLEDEFNE